MISAINIESELWLDHVKPATWYGLPVSNAVFGVFLSDTAVGLLYFDTDFSYIGGEFIFNDMMSLFASQNYTV